MGNSPNIWLDIENEQIHNNHMITSEITFYLPHEFSKLCFFIFLRRLSCVFHNNRGNHEQFQGNRRKWQDQPFWGKLLFSMNFPQSLCWFIPQTSPHLSMISFFSLFFLEIRGRSLCSLRLTVPYFGLIFPVVVVTKVPQTQHLAFDPTRQMPGRKWVLLVNSRTGQKKTDQNSESTNWTVWQIACSSWTRVYETIIYYS